MIDESFIYKTAKNERGTDVSFIINRFVHDEKTFKNKRG